ncbi:MAG: Gfo/Idh/MocA family oxidoreductase, partial [Planctomycetes bacterium]|nr:Gfo/Idh/MocA family oxidoreductase [Planctomycetota bacterium]
ESTLNRPVRIGIIGTGDEGNVLIGALNPDFVQVIAIADIRPYSIHRAFHGDIKNPLARPGLMKKYGWSTESEARQHVKVYDEHYEELLNDPNIEGVIVALPLFLHAEATIKAMRKGKHVLCEKLMAHSVHECKEMARVANELNMVLAIGHQRHYNFIYDNAVQAIKLGVIGQIHHIRAQWHKQKDDWKLNRPLPFAKNKKKKKPEDPDLQMDADIKKYEKEARKLLSGLPKKYDAAKALRREEVVKKIRELEAQFSDLGVDAAQYGYKDRIVLGHGDQKYELSALEELIRWRLWKRTGGGLMAELGAHQLDAASIFLSALRKDGKRMNPLSVTASGGRHLYEFDRDIDDHVYCIFEFPGAEYESNPNKKVVVTYSAINGNGFGGYGEVVMGTKGSIQILREKDLGIVPASGGKTTSVKVSQGEVSSYETGGAEVVEAKKGLPESRGYTEEIEHWAWCIRNRKTNGIPNIPRCHPKVALADACMALVANMAIEKQERIDFKPEWFDINSDETPEGISPDIHRREYGQIT